MCFAGLFVGSLDIRELKPFVLRTAVFRRRKCSLKFFVMYNESDSAGLYSRASKDHALTVWWRPIEAAFPTGSSDEPLMVCGTECYNRLDVLIAIVKHEICHILCCVWSTTVCTVCTVFPHPIRPHIRKSGYSNWLSVKDAHGPEFVAIAYSIFDQTEVTHELPTRRGYECGDCCHHHHHDHEQQPHDIDGTMYDRFGATAAEGHDVTAAVAPWSGRQWIRDTLGRRQRQQEAWERLWDSQPPPPPPPSLPPPPQQEQRQGQQQQQGQQGQQPLSDDFDVDIFFS